MVSKITHYGFEYEAATVERLASHKGYVIIGVRTPRQRVEIHVTPSGLLRVQKVYPVERPKKKVGR
jgi:hypothetical protein